MERASGRFITDALRRMACRPVSVIAAIVLAAIVLLRDKHRALHYGKRFGNASGAGMAGSLARSAAIVVVVAHTSNNKASLFLLAC